MAELEDKYFKGDLTVEELRELRRQVNATDDDTLGEAMRHRWMDGDLAEDDYTVATRPIWQRIETATRTAGHDWRRRAWKWMQAAAVFLVPVLLFSTYWFYRQEVVSPTGVAIFRTDAGGRATLVLPDGTSVVLNERSRLSYSPAEFNSTSRRVSFEGEAFFSVAKDSLHPFSIRAEGLDVRVVGTKFNLFARKGVALSRLSLEEGKVLFTSLASHRQTAVWPGQVAVLDKQTGRISVEQKPEEVNDATAWQRNELVFRNATLRHVIAVMETTYGVKFRFSGRLNMDDIFTGTLPSNNLGEGLEIIRHSYHVRAEQRNGVVTITK